MSARDDVFANIRRSLGVTGKEATRRGIVAQRLQEPSRGPIPTRGQGSPATKLATFIGEAQRVSATVVVLENSAAVPGEVARYLRDSNLPLQARLGADVRLTQLDWAGAAMTMLEGASAGADLTAVSHAFAGVAETGSLVVLSGPDNPVTLNFLPDVHVIVLAAADLFGDIDSVWTKLRRDLGKGVMPRTVNVITGPSRSADIEQTLLLGAHGPRRLHVLITLA